MKRKRTDSIDQFDSHHYIKKRRHIEPLDADAFSDTLNEHGEIPHTRAKRKRCDWEFSSSKKRKMLDLSPPYINSEDENYFSASQQGNGALGLHEEHFSLRRQMEQYNAMQEQKWMRQQEQREEFKFALPDLTADVYSKSNKKLFELHQERLTREPPNLLQTARINDDMDIAESPAQEESTPWFLVPYEEAKSPKEGFSISTHGSAYQQQHNATMSTSAWPVPDGAKWDPFANVVEQ